jgi:hypothetical protein
MPMRRMLLCSIVAAGAGCKKGNAVIDHQVVQTQVAAEAAELVGVKTTDVTCPKSQKPAAGGSFNCEARFEGGGALTFQVKQLDGAGTLAVEPTGDWLRGDEMESDLAAEMFLLGHEDAAVECGDAVIPVKLPGQVSCAVKNGAKTASVDVAVDAQRDVTWKVVGAL